MEPENRPSPRSSCCWLVKGGAKILTSHPNPTAKEIYLRIPPRTAPFRTDGMSNPRPMAPKLVWWMLPSTWESSFCVPYIPTSAPRGFAWLTQHSRLHNSELGLEAVNRKPDLGDGDGAGLRRVQMGSHEWFGIAKLICFFPPSVQDNLETAGFMGSCGHLPCLASSPVHTGLLVLITVPRI
jgi:hypothetical protein